ncbi:acyl carrier protein [Paenibacillus xanthanilyticus]|uniref:Acyl carrier protein n=1 Tax=Paenibacillus xanthanilyticus TaxID=1783531 RepID=A0ABV8K646_9BACL
MNEMKTDTIETIKRVLAEVRKNPDLAAAMTPSTDIVNDIGLDSLQMITFILSLEDAFSLEIDFETFDFDHLASIAKLSDYIAGRMKEHV